MTEPGFGQMRCEGADNPPCKRCAAAGHECVFERRADYLLKYVTEPE